LAYGAKPGKGTKLSKPEGNNRKAEMNLNDILEGGLVILAESDAPDYTPAQMARVVDAVNRDKVTITQLMPENPNDKQKALTILATDFWATLFGVAEVLSMVTLVAMDIWPEQNLDGPSPEFHAVISGWVMDMSDLSKRDGDVFPLDAWPVLRERLFAVFGRPMELAGIDI
jgi:hypothetical protein